MIKSAKSKNRRNKQGKKNPNWTKLKKWTKSKNTGQN